LSSWTGVSGYQNVSILDFIEAKDDGRGGDNWSYKTCKIPVKSSPPTVQHRAFNKPDNLPVTQPTVSKHLRELKVYSINHQELMATVFDNSHLADEADSTVR